ncbi:MAG: DUF1360 domain-containing protein, partial [Myxococcales bacterium]|nr:DUF1360 domain-containing protein [Myxococcales bacterium]
MGLSYTVAKEEMFRGMRDRCGRRSGWLGYLVSCPYCLSHWVAFVIVPLTGTYYVHMARHIAVISPIVDWFLSSILVTVVAAFLRVIFFFVDETQALTRKRKKVTEQVADKVAQGTDAARLEPLLDEPLSH